MTITVYTKPNCVQCKATFRALDKAGIDYTAVDNRAVHNPDAHNRAVGNHGGVNR